ncbi:helix-turn-helix transcriptional regulator [Ascidiaceihabitans sp.]|uniref:helix-turn-helix domain-containing protein n=1 Tax=Ascidiaceihabitans sp. TaxID=1872644 RepID=UPI003299460D
MSSQIEVWSPEKTVADWIDASSASLRTISAGTGISRSKLSDLTNGKSTLTVSDLSVIASFLGIDPGSIFPQTVSLKAVDGAYLELGSKLGSAVMENVQARMTRDGHQLSVEDIIAWHEITQGHLYQSAEVRPHLVAVKPVHGDVPRLRILDVGNKSLTWAKVQADANVPVTPKDVEAYFASSIAAPDRSSIWQNYHDAITTQGRIYKDRKLLHWSDNGHATITVYFTMLMAGLWHDDEPVVWNFSKEVYSRPATDAELSDLQVGQGSR